MKGREMEERRLRSLLRGALLAAVLSVCAGSTVWAAPAAVGDPLPKVSLPDAVTGAPVDVAIAFQGAPGALVFMQTSCAACRKELTLLKDLQLKYPALKIAAVSVDAGSAERVVRYREHFAFEFPFLHDPEFKVPELFGFAFTPALVLVGKDGKIAQLRGGFKPGDDAALEKAVAELVTR